MSKKKTVKSIVEKAKTLVAQRDKEIVLLKQKLINAQGEKSVVFKMPDIMEIANFPKIQKVHVENTPKVQDVNVIGLEKIKTEFPSLQKVEVINLPTIEVKDTASKWVPELIVHSVKTIAGMIGSLTGRTFTVKLDDEERLKPQPVIIVDVRGRPVNLAALGGGYFMQGSVSGSANAPASTISSGKATVVAGTATVLGSNVPCRKIYITAPAENSGYVFIGGTNVSASGGRGAMLTPTGSFTLDLDNLNKIYIDGTSNGDTVTYTYIR